jgi:hypothetical protein
VQKKLIEAELRRQQQTVGLSFIGNYFLTKKWNGMLCGVGSICILRLGYQQ